MPDTSEESIRLAVPGFKLETCARVHMKADITFLPILQSGYLRQNVVHTPCCKIYLHLV